jgi:hypothetical protein
MNRLEIEAVKHQGEPTVAQVIETIKARNVTLSVKIISDRPLLEHEKAVLKAHRREAIAIINGMTDPEVAYQRGKREGYALGVQHAMEELTDQPPSEAKPTLPTTTIDIELSRFNAWQAERGEYFRWEPECMLALRNAMVEGDRLQPLFAFTVIIVHVDGSETRFQRRPEKHKR